MADGQILKPITVADNLYNNYGSISKMADLEEKKKIVTKGDTVMDNMELEVNVHGTTANLALATSLRDNINKTISRVERTAYFLVAIDWLLFITAALCLAVLSMGITGNITTSFDLTQLLASITLGVKSIEKVLNLREAATTKKNQIGSLKILARRISVIEFSFYNNVVEDKPENRVKIAGEILEIWTSYNEIEFASLLALPSSDIASK
jgi:hypothetical protein